MLTLIDRKYIGTAGRSWPVARLIRDSEIAVEEGGIRTFLPLYLGLVDHSPSGFSWGYSGSGPMQAAFAICYHSLRSEYGTFDELKTNIQLTPAARQAMSVYKEFCHAVIANILIDDDFVLTHREVMEFITFAALKKK